MSVHPLRPLGFDPDVASVVEPLGAGVSFLGSMLKWILALNVIVGWIAFWSSIVGLHLSLGQVIGAVVTTVVLIVPSVAAFSLWVALEAGLRSGDIPLLGR